MHACNFTPRKNRCVEVGEKAYSDFVFFVFLEAFNYGLFHYICLRRCN